MIRLILSIDIVFAFGVYSQNLIPNSSFEDLKQCPFASSTFNPHELAYAAGWDYPTAGTSDLFSICASPGPVGVPTNFIGDQNPYDGNSYAGFGFYSDPAWNDIIVAEYVQTKLSRPLEINEKVQIRFYLSLAESSKYGSSKISVYFSEDLTNFNLLSNAPIALSEAIYSKNGESFSDKTNWTLFECDYVAKGCEKFMTIGCFDNTFDLDTIPSSPPTGDPNLFYYFLDSVSVVSSIQDYNFEFPNVITANDDKVNDIWYPDNICNENWHCNIVNRLGEEVYTFTSNDLGWNGTDRNGNNLPDGVYFYNLNINDFSKKCNGFIHLIR